MKKNTLLLLTLGTICGTILFTPCKTHAQAFSISLSPANQEIVSQPGKEITTTYRIENPGDPIILQTRLYKMNLHTQPTNIQPVYAPNELIQYQVEKKDYDFEEPFILTQNKTIHVPVRITIAEETPEQDYVYIFAVESYPPQHTEGETSALLQGTVGSSTLFQITDTAQAEDAYKITLFEPIGTSLIPLFGQKWKVVPQGKSVDLILQVENRSTTQQTTVQGGITLKRRLLKERIAHILTLQPTRIFPVHQETLHIQEEICTKDCSPKSTVTLHGLDAGMYHATALVYRKKGSSRIVSQATNFLVLPLMHILGLLGGVACAIAIAIYIVFKKKKHANEKNTNRRKKEGLHSIYSER